jgi:antitoxin component of MazEF toxin-antitoxin module
MHSRRLKLRENGGNLVLTIPRDIRRYLGIEVGSDVDIHYDSQKLIVDLTSFKRTKLFDPPAEELEPEEAVPEVEAA